MFNIQLGIIGDNVVATASDNSGDSPTAYTISQLRDVLMALSEEKESIGKENAMALLIMDGVLESLEGTYKECYADPK